MGVAPCKLFSCVVQGVVRMLSLGVAGFRQHFRHIGPQFPPRLLLLGRQFLSAFVSRTPARSVSPCQCSSAARASWRSSGLPPSTRLLHCSRSARSQANACWRSRLCSFRRVCRHRSLDPPQPGRRNRRRHNDARFSTHPPVSGQRRRRRRRAGRRRRTGA